MKMIVGLGNPGRKYVGTRHNVGYEVLGELARRFGTGKVKKKFQAEVVEAAIEDQSVILLSPLTYMNLSGQSVQPARDFYKLDNSQLLIVCDDFHLTLAKLRFRAHGSAGGQRGLADIIQRLGTQDVPRLRIGIGPVPERCDPADFVLGRFLPEELPVIQDAVSRAANAAADWTKEGIEYCMNQYNG